MRRSYREAFSTKRLDSAVNFAFPNCIADRIRFAIPQRPNGSAFRDYKSAAVSAELLGWGWQTQAWTAATLYFSALGLGVFLPFRLGGFVILLNKMAYL